MKILENALLWKKAISGASAEPAAAPSETIDIDQEPQQEEEEEVPAAEGDSALGKRKADEQLSAQ